MVASQHSNHRWARGRRSSTHWMLPQGPPKRQYHGNAAGHPRGIAVGPESATADSSEPMKEAHPAALGATGSDHDSQGCHNTTLPG